MNRDQDNDREDGKKTWRQRLDQLLQQTEQDDDSVLSQRLSEDDPAMADIINANLIQTHLDDIGIQKVSAELHKNLYAIPDQTIPDQTRTFTSPLWRWGALASAAVIFAIAVLITPWRNSQPSFEEIAQARQQLAITFYYLNKAAQSTRHYTQTSIAEGVHTAMDSSVFLAPEETINL